MPMPDLRRSSLPLLLLVLLPCAALPAAELEAIGEDMGYRMHGTGMKNSPILLQNSRPHPIEIFDEGRGLFAQIPPFTDLQYACRGKSRKLNLRYRDGFREAAPFQVIVECGREIQFIAPDQIAAPVSDSARTDRD